MSFLITIPSPHKFVLSLVISIAPFCTQSQNFSDLYDKGINEAKRNDYPSAIKYLEQASLTAEEVLGKESLNLGSFLYNLAGFYQKTNAFEKADSCYQKALQIRKSKLGKNNPEYLKTLLTVAQLHYWKGSYKNAKQYYQQVKLLSEKEENTSIHYAKALNGLGLVYLQSDSLNTAEQLLQESYGILWEGQFDDPDLILTLNALAFIKGKFKEYRAAIDLYLKVLSLQEAKLREGSPEILLTQRNLARMYNSDDQYDKAIQFYEKVLDPNNTGTVVSKEWLEDQIVLSSLYLNKGQLPLADSLLIHSETIGKDHYNKEEKLYYDLLFQQARLNFWNKNLYQAERKFQTVVTFYESTNELSYDDYINSIQNLIKVQLIIKKYAEAEDNLLKAIKFLEKENLSQSEKYIELILDLSSIKITQKNYQAALEHYKKAQLIAELQPELKREILYMKINHDLAELYLSMKQWSTAAKILQMLLEKNSNNDLEHAKILSQYAACMNELGAIDQAKLYFEKSLKIYKNISGSNKNIWANTLNNLATLNKNQGFYLDAEYHYKQALELATDEVLKSNIYTNQGVLYHTLGKYNESESTLLKSLQIHEKTHKSPSGEQVFTLLQLGLLYKTKGKYQQSESIFQKALLAQHTLTENSELEATLYNHLSQLYKVMGRYEQALSLLNQSLKIKEDILGQKHPDYAKNLDDLASLYKLQKNYDLALEYYKKALDIRLETLGENSADYATSLDNLANFYQSIHYDEDALSLYEKALDLRLQLFGENHPSYAASLNNLAILLEKTGKYQKAIKLYQKSIDIIQSTLGSKHYDYIVTLHNLALLYENLKNYEKAKIYHNQVIQIIFSQLKELFPTLSQEEKQQYYLTHQTFIKNYSLFIIKAIIDSKNQIDFSLLEALYDLQLRTKAIILNVSSRERDNILQNSNPKLVAQYEKWIHLRESIAKLEHLNHSQVSISPSDLENLKKQANTLEKELSQMSNEFSETFHAKSLTWKDIREKLRENELAMEIIRIPQAEDKILYLALWISKEAQHPMFCLLPKGYEMENEWLSYHKNCIKFNKEDLRTYNIFWEEIKRHLPEEIERIYLSPDGVYHQINLNTLYNTQNKKFLLDEIEINLLTNTKDLLDHSTQKTSIKSALVIGNPSFQFERKIISDDYFDHENPQNSWLKNPRFKKLEGTQKEVENISLQLRKNHIQTELIVQEDATESHLKEKIKKANILHIATHGFFIPTSKDVLQDFIPLSPIDTDRHPLNPMLRSGLILAGITDYFLGKRSMKDDGLLTSYEIMNMSLKEVDLVVLSACETGLGKIQNGEGVYGLQRALKIAGCRSIIMSLWKVDDNSTQELMSLFYTNWLAGKSKKKALRDAQITLRQKYPDPYHWGAFVIVE